MLLKLSPELLEGVDPGPTPGWLEPLHEGARHGRPLHEAVQAIITTMGFTSFGYGVTTAAHLNHDERFYYWSTTPPEWLTEYDQNSYVEIDPRVRHGWTELTPMMWDRSIAQGDPKTAWFLDRAATYGIGSGVDVYLRETGRAKIMVGFNEPPRVLTPERRAEISERLGDYMLFGTIFHALFLRATVERGLIATPHGLELSRREIECLNLAARGQTSRDIAFKLGIAERTVSFHFSNILTKLNAMNRPEAIAKATSLGIVQVG